MYFTSLSLLMTLGDNWRDAWNVEKWMKGEAGGEEESDKINCTSEC